MAGYALGRKGETMKRMHLWVLLFAVAATGCAKKASEEIDFGTIEDSVYRNKYFGLTLTVPDDWNVQSQEARQQLMDQGGKMLAGEDKNLKAAVKASEKQTVNLLTAFKHPMGAPVPYNPNIIAVAERIRHMPGIKTGQDYYFHAKKLIESSPMDVTVREEGVKETLGGREFAVMEVDMGMGKMVVHQKYYTAIMKGYALAFIVSYSTDEELKLLKGILDSVTLE